MSLDSTAPSSPLNPNNMANIYDLQPSDYGAATGGSVASPAMNSMANIYDLQPSDYGAVTQVNPEGENPVLGTADNFLTGLGADYTNAGQGIENSVTGGATQMAEGLSKITNPGTGGAGTVLGGVGDIGRGIIQSGVGAAGNFAAGVFAPITQTAKTLIPTGTGPITEPLSTTAQGAGIGATFGGPWGALIGGSAGLGYGLLNEGGQVLMQNPKIASFVKNNPDVVPDIQNALTIGMSIFGSNKAGDIMNAPVEDAPATMGENLYNTARGIKSIIPSALGGGISTPYSRTLAAINPDLNARGLTTAYERSALGGAGVQESGIGTPSSPGVTSRVSSDAQILTGLGVSDTNTAARNLNILGDAMTATEAEIKPYENTPVSAGVKRVVLTDLEGLKTQIPDEFKTIGGDSPAAENAYNKVINFAKTMVANAKDTIGAYRDTRTNFDAQAKIQYPSAFNPDGSMNLKTPTGIAINAVRTLLNNNMYDIAPTDLDLQGKINTEAAIYRAIHNIAPDAAAENGLTSTGQFLNNHPWIPKAVKWGTGIAVGSGITGSILGHMLSPQAQNSNSTPSGE